MGAGSEGPPSDPVVVGRVIRSHGIAGELVVEPMSDGSRSLTVGARLWLNEMSARVLRCREHRGRLVVLLEGIADRDAAEALRGGELLIAASELPPLEEGSYYVHELVGCRVVDAAGAPLGEVVAVLPGPRDWLEIDDQGTRSLVPMAREMLRGIDLQGRRIVIDVPPGLLEATAVQTGGTNGAPVTDSDS